MFSGPSLLDLLIVKSGREHCLHTTPGLILSSLLKGSLTEKNAAIQKCIFECRGEGVSIGIHFQACPERSANKQRQDGQKSQKGRADAGQLIEISAQRFLLRAPIGA